MDNPSGEPCHPRSKYIYSMASSGYSGTPLIKKLGIKPNQKILIINEPNEYFELLEGDISKQRCSPKEIPDLVHLFVKSKKEFEDGMKKIKSYATKNSNIIIWVSWYKKSSGIATDVSEDSIRNFALRNELVDIKVCAVTELWSGLKLVVPVALRKK